jgi:tyrosine-protein kinase Etk/Wzc
MNQNKELFGNNKGSEVNIREALYNYIKNWQWFVICAVISLCLGYVYVQYQIPQYKVEIDLLIKDNKSASTENDLLQQLNLNSSGKIIENEIEILKSNTLWERVVNSLGLQTLYYVQNRISRKIFYKNIGYNVELLKPNSNSYAKPWTANFSNNTMKFNGKPIAFNIPVQTEAGLILITPAPGVNITKQVMNVQFTAIDVVAQSYIDNLKIVPASKESTVLEITLEDADPRRGKDVLNKLVDEYKREAIEDKNVTTANQLSFLKNRINAIAVELNSVERNVQNYKSSNGIMDMSSESTTFLNAVQANDAEISKLQIQKSTLANLENYLKLPDNDQVRLPAMLGVLDPTLLALVNQLGEAQIKKQSLLRTIPETNPIVSSINDQIKSLKQTIVHTLQNLKSGVSVTEQQLKNQASQYKSTIRNVPSKERGLVDVMREQSIKNNLFTYLLQKREETALSLASTVADSRTIDAAKGGKYPIKPVKATLYLTFLLMGLFLPFAVIAIKETLNVKIRSRADIEKYTNAAILADISQTTERDPLIAVSKPRSMIAEQIRALRSNLQYISPQLDHKVLLFTSSISGEGKSFVSLNLGASLATTNKKVIILELDLRKPKLNIALNIDNTRGISNYLIGQVDYKDIIQPIPGQENYYIMTSGPNPPNPAELLLNGRIDILINQLKQDYDYVLLDAPPVGLVTDAQILSNFADATMYIVRYNYTVKNQIKIIDELYQRQMFKNFNIIFNALDAAAISYGYGYGYGYYEEDQSEKKLLLAKLFSRK